MKEGGSLQVLDLEFSSASVYRGNTVIAVELLSALMMSGYIQLRANSTQSS